MVTHWWEVEDATREREKESGIILINDILNSILTGSRNHFMESI